MYKKVLITFLLTESLVNGFIFSSVSIGEITPINPYTVVGEHIKLDCTVTPKSGLFASDILFEDVKGVTVDGDHIQVVGERTLRFKKLVTSVDEAGTYLCLRKDKSNVDAVVAATNLKVEYTDIHNVTDISCILLGDELACNWTLGRYQYPSDIKVNAVIKLNEKNSQIQCPEKHVTEFCRWGVPGVEKSGNITIILSVTNIEMNVTKSFTEHFSYGMLRK